MTFTLAGIKPHSTVDGPGVRFVIFFQGCNHKCFQCHNSETWDINGGLKKTTEEIISEITLEKYIDGITLSGGDPLLQSQAAKEIAMAAKKRDINVWCYTGFTYEQIIHGEAGKEAIELLHYVDTLVDGPFVLSKKSDSCKFRGSSNQRLIDVQKSLKQNNVIEQNEFDFGL